MGVRLCVLRLGFSCGWVGCFLNDVAATEMYTGCVGGSGGCVYETGVGGMP